MASYPGRGVHGHTVELLGARIVSGEVTEGELLDPRALAAELDISLTVVREAMKALAGKGLIAARQKHGTFVRPYRDWNLFDADVIRWSTAGADGARLLRDLAEVRAIVEPAAARHAALRRRPEDLAALDTALARMAAAGGDAAAAAAADAEFHRALLRATGNDMLARMDLLLEPGLRERDLIVHAGQDVDDPVPSHRAVADAIAAGDAEGAGDAMTALLRRAAEDLRRASDGGGGDTGSA
ncbi:FadR/GntR family transcriptional regulator [Streptomyces tsukubensis]|uniref:GntR family transcriptional regulator n=1 Tax=Streptomyces tsukubensis TaxID=83656 RepID=A0A1V3ZY83_9ACTN|nr:FCD domain-containing protein [Streptomyces tsukubensis]OON71358.1 GntR family transcriptional regulator [Streptomyces tsukubensis]QFR92332.1 FCD domain-containing protein [Streptomyces tsukubensis]